MITAEHLTALRSQFSALARQIGGQPVVYFDGPAGTQTPQSVIDAIGHYLAHTNANHGGVFATSRESDALLHEAHSAAADLLNAPSGDEIAFGANMTTLTFAFSRALAQTWNKGDEILVTRLDHDANVSPWVLAARDAGALVRRVELNAADQTLNLDDFRKKLSPRTRLVAVGCASNATGTINPLQEITQAAHAVGALVFADAVHYAPHARIDVQAWGCDFLACSAYKFFGPHVGLLWGRRDLLERLMAYKVRPAPNDLPGKWMTGTQNHEGIAGTLAAIEYLAQLGRTIRGDSRMARREALDVALTAIADYERSLAEYLLAGLEKLATIKVYGITDRARLAHRVPTFSLVSSRHSPQELATFLAERGIFVWHGNYYALELSEALHREPQGMVRVGLVHYNTKHEIDRFLAALAET